MDELPCLCKYCGARFDVTWKRSPAVRKVKICPFCGCYVTIDGVPTGDGKSWVELAAVGVCEELLTRHGVDLHSSMWKAIADGIRRHAPSGVTGESESEPDYLGPRHDGRPA